MSFHCVADTEGHPRERHCSQNHRGDCQGGTEITFIDSATLIVREPVEDVFRVLYGAKD